MNFLLELRFFILSHPVTSKQPQKIVQIHIVHPVELVSDCDFRSVYIVVPNKFNRNLVKIHMNERPILH